MITPADWDQGYQIHRGATFNLAHNLSQMLHLRPRNRFEDLESVYLVGGGTHPGSGLPVIYESARITARLLGEDLGIPVQVDAATTPAPTRQTSASKVRPGEAVDRSNMTTSQMAVVKDRFQRNDSEIPRKVARWEKPDQVGSA